MTKTLTIGPKLKTALPGPNATRILAADEQYMSPSYTRSYPLVAKRGRGIVIEDVDGNEFFDFSAGIAVTSTGHCHPEVVAAIQKQAGELSHMSGTDFYYEGMVTLAERLSKIALACARYIEDQLFKTILAPEEVAAIFVEPIQGEGGYVIAPTIFMQELRRICDKHGILLVLDEIQSGIGRTGKWFAVEHTGVHPDMVCIAKGIASGMPLGITMSKAEIMDWVPGSHASTFGGNPVCIAAALATLDVIEKEGLLKNSQEVGDHMLKRMAGWPRKHKIVGDVRGRGLMIGVEIVKDQKTREYGASERDRIVELAFERGVLFLGCGPSTVRIAPPLIVTKDEADVAMDALEESIAVVETNA